MKPRFILTVITSAFILVISLVYVRQLMQITELSRSRVQSNINKTDSKLENEYRFRLDKPIMCGGSYSDTLEDQYPDFARAKEIIQNVELELNLP
jgi:hypothetical protein